MATKKIFISFDYEHDSHYKNLLLAWSANPGFPDFYINDQSVTVPVDSPHSGPIRRVISSKIADASAFLCIVGTYTWRSRWIAWEIEKAKELRKRIIAVKISKECRTPDALLGAGASWALSFTLEGVKNAIDSAYA